MLSVLTAGATALIITAGSTVAQAAVWTDHTDYSPGSVVTFHGDNSDGAGYLAGETVQVAVNDPSGSTQSCTATADSTGAWSCQITLDSGIAAIGVYSYTATGQTSGVSQSGTFTDSNCKAASSLGTELPDPLVTASYTTSGGTATYSVTSTNENTNGGIPGLIEYCVYPGTFPDSGTALYDSWTYDPKPGNGYFAFGRPGGDPTNLPFDGTTKTVGSATWSGGVPSQTIVLHINDPAECTKLYGSGTTCFVLPGTGNQDLTVSKTATPSFTRTYTWGIQKSVDNTKLGIPQGGSAKFNYTVAVTHDSGTDSNWQVTGDITVSNPNAADFNGVNVTDSGGGSCQVTGGSGVTVPAGGSVKLPYTCSYSSNPGAVTDTATAAWDASAYNTPDSQATASAGADFSTATPTIVDGSVTVTDSLGGGTLGTVSYSDPSPTDFTYSHTFSGDPAGTCTTHPNTATLTSAGGSDSGAVLGTSSQTVQVCVGEDLTVAKTATPSFTRTYIWNISKSVDNTTLDIPQGGSATFNYQVAVTHNNGTDSNWEVQGDIKVTNPNDWEAVPLTSLTDAIDNGGSCVLSTGSPGSVDPTNATIPAATTVDFPYTCTYSSAPSASGFTNTATAVWDKSAAATPDGSAAGTATGDFSTPTTVVDGSVTVTDPLGGGTLGTLSYTGASPTDFTYSKTFPGTPGTCTSYPNTATLTSASGSDSGAVLGTSSQTVQVCVGEDLTVAKSAATSFTRTYNWAISKSVSPTLIEQFGGTASANYTVNVKETGFTDSGWRVAGTITVANPNNWEDITLTGTGLTDTIDNNGSCTVSNGSPGNINPTSGVIAASTTVTFPYTCTYSSAPSPASGTNTATASWAKDAAHTPDGSANGTANYAFTTPTKTVNQTITPVDTFNNGSATYLCKLTATVTPCTLTATGQAPFTSQAYTYSRSLTVPAFNCLTYPNTAMILETGQNASASVEACGPAKTGALTMGFWQNKNGQGIITGGSSTGGVCNSGTWLRQYAPFQDLSASATCSQVAAYVTNIIKAANASGASMNAMLKAQMLATALDVYFSAPSLGGNKISAPAPVGGVSIDLTKICHMIDSSSGTGTCSGTFENVSSAFGGATSLTVSQLLSYAATQSNAGGSIWYANVKATQQLAKDAFDAINNQVAFSP